MAVNYHPPAVGPCPYEGTRKVFNPDTEWTSAILCVGHAQDWLRVFPESRIVTPRNLFGDKARCTGNWALPAEVP